MPQDPIHPGKILADELAALNMNPTELAHILHVPPPNRIYQLLNGKKAHNGSTSLSQ
jgi:plasmid maintenance system antidote protein VapI